MKSPGGESKAFTFFRHLFFLGSIALLTAGLGWNWGYHAKYRQGKDFFTWGKLLYAERSLDLIHRQLVEIAPKRS